MYKNSLVFNLYECSKYKPKLVVTFLKAGGIEIPIFGRTWDLLLKCIPAMVEKKNLHTIFWPSLSSPFGPIK